MKGHLYGVYSITLSQSNKKLYSGSADNMIGIWTCKSHKKERSLEGHGCTVTALSLSKNERFLFTLGADNLLIVWNLAQYKIINKLDIFSSSSYSQSFALSDKFYTIFGRDKQNPCKLRILNLLSGDTVKMVKVHSKAIRCVTVAPDDNYFYTGGSDNLVHVFKTENADLVHAISSHNAPINNLTVSKDSKFLASASNDNTVRLFNANDNFELVHIFKHAVEVSAILFSKSHQKLVTGGWHFRPIKVWNTNFLNIEFDSSFIETPGKFFMSKSPVNRGLNDKKATDKKVKMLDYSQNFENKEETEFARRSIDDFYYMSESLKGSKVSKKSMGEVNSNLDKFLMLNGGTLDVLPDHEFLNGDASD